MKLELRSTTDKLGSGVKGIENEFQQLEDNVSGIGKVFDMTRKRQTRILVKRRWNLFEKNLEQCVMAQKTADKKIASELRIIRDLKIGPYVGNNYYIPTRNLISAAFQIVAASLAARP